MSEPWELSATDALTAMRAKELSPVELLASVRRRADAVEPTVNALCERRTDEADAAAVDSADRYARGEDIRALEGLPVALKEEVPVRGWRMRYGSLAVDEIATETAPIAERIFDAGAVVHARTTTPEFSCTGYTHSKLWGVTRNAWNPEVCVGGSSGGSGASLASGTSVLATGSDIGGSIRVPASINGVVGFKAPHGRVPTLPPFNLDRYCHDGAMARTIADAALFHNAVAGRHPADMTSLPAVEIPPTLDAVDGMRIAVCADLGSWTLDPDVEANTRAAAAALEDAGAKVDEVQLPWSLEKLMYAARRHFASIFGAYIGEVCDAYPDLVNDYSVAWADDVRALVDEPGSVLHGLEMEGELWRPLGAIFEEYDAFICATWAVTGLAAGDSVLGQVFDDGGPNDRQFLAFMTTPFNIFSACPVLAVPSGIAASNGVPTGIQIVARPFDDVTAFRVGAALERVRPWAALAPMVALNPASGAR
jgi:Asp-tRNA(Asn)/Glu-tRNA(Gln) amidotransferase A subunit family amidase